MTIAVSGTWPDDKPLLVVNLISAKSPADMMFHFKPDSNNGWIMRNSMTEADSWHPDQETDGGLPAGLQPGSNFNFEFKYTDTKWEVSIDGDRHGGTYDMVHRFKGDAVRLAGHSFTNLRLTATAKSYESFDENEAIPLSEGTTITVTGTWPVVENAIRINLWGGTSGVLMFHFKPDQGKGRLMRNSWSESTGWSDEETDGGLPPGLLPGSKFSFKFTYTDTKWEVSIDGDRHGGIFDYIHRFTSDVVRVRPAASSIPHTPLPGADVQIMSDANTC